MPGGGHGEMEFGGQAAARAAERVIIRLGRQAVRARPAGPQERLIVQAPGEPPEGVVLAADV